MNTQAFLDKRAIFRAKYFPEQEPVKFLGLRPELRKLRQDLKRLKKKFHRKSFKTERPWLVSKDFNQQRLGLVQVAQAVRNEAHQRYLDKYGEA